MRLWHKAVVLIALPLVVEGALLLAIKNAQDAVDTAHAAKQRLNEQEIHVYRTIKAAMDAVVDIANYRGSRKVHVRERCENALDRLDVMQKDLEAEGNPHSTKEVQSLLTDVITQLHEALAAPGTEPVPFDKIDQYVEMNLLLRRALKAIEARQVTLEDEQAQAADLILQRRAELERLMVVAIIATAGVAACLAAFFHRDTVTQINTLMDNVSRMAKNKPLLPELKGNSELAQLDNAFHSMEQAINKLTEEKKEFLSMVTHDLRSPIASSQASLELLKKDPALAELSDDGNIMVDRMLANNAKLLTLISDLLDAEKLETGMIGLTPELVSFNDLVEECFSFVKILAEVKGVALSADDSDMLIYCDSPRMVQVLVNLVANAIKFSPRDSKVHVSVSVDKDASIIAVSDQGPGIAAEFIPRMFERYSQAGPGAKNGSGVGLWVTHRLVEMHQGSVSVDSKEGHGTTISVQLPTKQ